MKSFLKPGINWLAVFIPLTFALAWIPGAHDELALFASSLLGMMVVSAWIGDATEQLASRIGPTWGGMLNAAFGNLPELIFGLIAIRKGLGPLVKAAWTGAVISNLLVVIGAAMVVGGIRYGTLKFHVERANDASTSMLIAAVAVFLPSVYASATDILPNKGSSSDFVEDISLWISALLLVGYATALVHTVLVCKAEDAARRLEQSNAPVPLAESEDAWSVQFASAILAVASFLIALLSDFVADSVDTVKSSLGWSDLFIGVIVIALIGNMSSLFSAVKMARKNQMDLSFEIGMSSAKQISLLVVPALVICSRWLGHPVDAQFSMPEVASIFGTILITSQIAQDGRANWLNGVQMLILYAMIAVMFYYLPG